MLTLFEYKFFLLQTSNGQGFYGKNSLVILLKVQKQKNSIFRYRSKIKPYECGCSVEEGKDDMKANEKHPPHWSVLYFT